MAVDTKHPDYLKYEDRWTRCRDAAEGEDAVKAAGAVYLPRLGGMDETDYAAYKQRALWYGATSRTIEGLRGAVFRKDPMIDVPPAVDPLLDRLTDDNLDAVSLGSEVLTQQLKVGRLGLLVDMPNEIGADPYVSRYTAENIINWRTTLVKGKEVLSLVVLREVYAAETADPFETKEAKRYRVLRMDGNVYVQEVWDEKGKLVDTLEPRRLGARLNFIPFRFINVTTLTATPEKPPLVDVVDVNLSHYRTSADLEHGAHFTALPTPWLAGFPMDKKFAIGSGVAFVTDNVNAKADMLEFTGKGLGTLIDIKSGKEKLMAVLGARLLEEQRKGVEAAETVRMRGSGESGALSTMARTSSRALTDVLGWVCWWKGAAQKPEGVDEIQYNMNMDFLDEQLSPQMLQALLQALQAGAISKLTWSYNLERGELYPPEHTSEDELAMIDVESGAPDEPDTDDEQPMLTMVEGAQ